jgi:hypothetical protein
MRHKRPQVAGDPNSDRKSDQVDAEKLARYARLDPNLLRPIAHRTWLRTFRANYSDRQLPKKRLQRPALRNLATQ